MMLAAGNKQVMVDDEQVLICFEEELTKQLEAPTTQVPIEPSSLSLHNWTS